MAAGAWRHGAARCASGHFQLLQLRGLLLQLLTLLCHSGLDLDKCRRLRLRLRLRGAQCPEGARGWREVKTLWSGCPITGNGAADQCNRAST